MRFRGVLGRFLAAALITSGAGIVVVETIQGIVEFQPAASPVGPVASSRVLPAHERDAYGAAYTRSIGMGALFAFDHEAAAIVWDQGRALLALIDEDAPDAASARALVEDQLTYVAWLLDCHAIMTEAAGRVAAGVFAGEARALEVDLQQCDQEAIAWVQSALGHRSQYPGYRVGLIDGYGSWERSAFSVLRLLGDRSAQAREALESYSTFFQGPTSHLSMAEVEDLLASKGVQRGSGAAAPSASILATDEADQASLVGFWLRHAIALGEANPRLEILAADSGFVYCAFAGTRSYCPAGSEGTVALSVAPGASQVSVLWSETPEGTAALVVRNAGDGLADVKVVIRCLDGTVGASWRIGSLAARSHSIPFDRFGSAECTAVLQVLAGDAVLAVRAGELMGELGFTA